MASRTTPCFQYTLKRTSTSSNTSITLLVVLLICCSSTVLADFEDSFVRGNDLCPCLRPEEMVALDPSDITEELIDLFGGNLTDVDNYGVGCGQHDQVLPECSNPSCSGEVNVLPKSFQCDLSYCNLNFCFVNPNNCQLLNRRSLSFPNTYRFYSYATCWDVDSFTSSRRISSLDSRVFNVGFNSNSGGWQGTYSSEKLQFEGPVDLWMGPTLDFALIGAERAGYRMNLTVPPAFLRENSNAYFSSSSNFDFCVYATSLGYLDFCLAQYTITNQRATTTDWLVLGSQDIRLIVQYEEDLTGWNLFYEQLRTIFSPFTDDVWIFMILFVIPVLGALMIIHEYDQPGSTYPKEEEVLVKNNKSPASIAQIERRRVPIYKHVSRAIYTNFLSVLQQNYGHPVLSYGAMVHLIGISFFILTIIAVYTANLAAVSMCMFC